MNMGRIRRIERKLRHDEIQALAELMGKSSNREWWGSDVGELSSAKQAIEFDISIDRIVKKPIPDLPEDTQPYLLEVGEVLRIGFETCFMSHSVVSGEFPSSRVHVVFAVRPSAQGGFEDLTNARWAIAFHWSGEAMAVSEDLDPPQWDSVVPIYRLSALAEAEEQYESAP